MSYETVGQTARKLWECGYKPVLIRQGTKRPVHQSWETLEYNAETIAEFDGPHSALGLRWGQGHIDVDLETPLVAAMGDALLPTTSMMWGRPSLDRSHRVYAVQAVGFRTMKLKNPARELYAELRHHDSQSVVPPSIHPESQGQYTWMNSLRSFEASDQNQSSPSDGVSPHAQRDPVVQEVVANVPEVDISELEVAVKETVFAAVAAELWPMISGSRHDSMLGICGMLLKAGRSLERVQKIAALIVQHGLDPDPADRLQIPEQTSLRLAEGLDVAGYRLVEQSLGPEMAKWIAKMFHLPVEKLDNIGGVPLNDVGNSEIFCSLFGEDLMYLPFKKDWCAWDGTKWQLMNSSMLEQTKAKETVKHLASLAGGLSTATERATMRQHALESGDVRAISAMIKLSRDSLATSEDVLDTNPWYFNVSNGTLDLTSGELLPHNREHKITKISPIEYDPKAECPQWLGFLDTVFAGDVALIDFMQRVSGYCLTGNTREQCLFFLYGHGKNGKTTWIEVMTRICKEYAARIPADTIIRKRAESGIPNDIARLRGMRFVASKEMDAGNVLAENVVKDLTGGDTTTARFLHGEWFDFKPVMKLIMYGNHKPTVRGQDEGIWRRIKMVPFSVQIANPIDDYASKLVDEEGPGILRWCVEGCLKWQVSGLMTPAAVSEATKEYRSEMDALGEFLEDRFEDAGSLNGSARGAKETMESVYNLYANWCVGMGERQMSQRALNGKLIEKGYEKVKSNGKWYIQGLKARAASGFTLASAMDTGN